MELVVKKLSEIEATAEKIMEEADYQKKEIAKSMEEKTKAYDQEIDEETKSKLLVLKAEYKIAVEKELHDLQAKTEGMMGSMERAYQQQHTQIADQIFNKIVGA